MKPEITIDNNDKKWLKTIISKIIESTSLLIAVAGCVMMILQGCAVIDWPHGFIAGISCFGFAWGFFLVEKIGNLIELKINNKKTRN